MQAEGLQLPAVAACRKCFYYFKCISDTLILVCLVYTYCLADLSSVFAQCFPEDAWVLPECPDKVGLDVEDVHYEAKYQET